MSVEVRDDQSALENQPIAKLRAIASAEGVPITRDMKAEMILMLIKEQRNAPLQRAREASGDRPDPGWCRLEIHKDPDPMANKTDVYASVNGYAVLIQRGMKVDVPIKILRGSLMNSKNLVLREDTRKNFSEEGRFYFEEVYNYPFTVYDINEGPDPPGRHGSEIANIKKGAPRRAFHAKYGYWPKSAELRDYIRSGGRDTKKGE